MSDQASPEARFDHPPTLDIPEPTGLADTVLEVNRMREMRLAELQAFVTDLEAEQGSVTEDELQTIRDEWLA